MPKFAVVTASLSLAILVAIPCPSLADQQSDIDMHTVYCMDALTWSINYLQKRSPDPQDPVGKEVMSKLQMDLRRLQLYFATRIDKMDPAAFLAASSAATETTNLMESVTQSCSTKCAGSQDAQCALNCSGDLIPDSIRKKNASCRDLSWLPF